MEYFRCLLIQLCLKMGNKNENVGIIIKPPVDLKIEREGALLPGERSAFIGRREEIPDGEARVSGDRESIYDWLSKALERKNHRAKTEDGQMYYIERADVKEYCMLKCTDGIFQMPAYTIVFEDGE